MMRIGVVLVFVINAFGVYGQRSAAYSLKDFVVESEVLVEGRVISKTPFFGFDGLIYTHYQFEVLSLYKGDISDNIVDVMSLGGTMEDEALIVCPSLHFYNGETGLLGLRQTVHAWVDNDYFMPVSANHSWVRINYSDNSANDFNGDRYTTSGLKKNIEELTGSKSVLISEDEPKDAPESMVTISGVTPLTTQAGRGKEITVTGSGFGATQGVGEVLFRDVNYSVSTISRGAVIYNSWSDTQIKVIVPYNAGSGSIKVQNNVGMLSPASSQSLSITYNVVNVNLSESVYHIDHNQDGNGGYNFVYSTNTNNGGVDFTSIPSAISAVDRATTSWNSGSDFTIFTEEACGTTLAQEPGRDGNNLFTFDNDLYDLDIRRGSSVLGIMFSYYSRCNSPWELVEMDVILRRDGDPNGFGGSVNWEYGPSVPSGGEADFESVVLHELGHGHQLGHCRVSGSVMYPIIALGTTRRNLTSSETQGGGYVQGESTSYVPPVSGGCPPPQNAARQYFNYNASNKCSLVLPLELVKFTAETYNHHSVELSWTTVNEINHDRIDLQYLAEGSSEWKMIETFKGRGGNGIAAEYSYLHQNLDPTLHLYRLAIYDQLGKVEYSEIRSTQIVSSKFILNTKIIGGQLYLKTKAEQLSQLELEVFGVGGQRICRSNHKVSSGTSEIAISCHTWKSGIYVLKWQILGIDQWGTDRFFID